MDKKWNVVFKNIYKRGFLILLNIFLQLVIINILGKDAENVVIFCGMTITMYILLSKYI